MSAPRSPMAPVNPYSGGAPANTVASYTGSLEPPQRPSFSPQAGGGGQQSYFSGGKPRRKAPPGYGTTPPPRNRPGNRKTGRPKRIGGQRRHRRWKPHCQSNRCLLKRNHSVRHGEHLVILVEEGIDMSVRRKFGKAFTQAGVALTPLLDQIDDEDIALNALMEKYGIKSLDELPFDISIPGALDKMIRTGRYDGR